MTITYTEKGPGLHAVIQAAGHSLSQVDGEWISTNDEAVQAIIEAYDPMPTAKEKKWREIQAMRDALASGGVRVGEHRFHSDAASRIQQIGLVLMGQGVPAGLMWKTVGGAFVPMTPTLAMQIFQATAGSDAAIFAAAETHKAKAWALPSIEQIEAYDFSAGWPKV